MKKKYRNSKKSLKNGVPATKKKKKKKKKKTCLPTLPRNFEDVPLNKQYFFLGLNRVRVSCVFSSPKQEMHLLSLLQHWGWKSIILL